MKYIDWEIIRAVCTCWCGQQAVQYRVAEKDTAFHQSTESGIPFLNFHFTYHFVSLIQRIITIASKVKQMNI